VALCCLTRRLHNVVLPEYLALAGTAGMGQQQLYSWLLTTNISYIQKQKLMVSAARLQVLPYSRGSTPLSLITKHPRMLSLTLSGLNMHNSVSVFLALTVLGMSCTACFLAAALGMRQHVLYTRSLLLLLRRLLVA
jgi:hypothetical protein